MPNIWVDGVIREMTEAEIKAWENALAVEETPTEAERIAVLEETKAEQSDVDELHEALDMILTGVTE
ncbi:hypothetical protein [Pseudoflavonifractor phocaeensis]|uniref:hypothetical protein n=1 Tax=Pseudoflavonifractor phocaeensis TaxID=1870988 RepID=UPI001957405C|nr:hypothetical protein [Pseudoflavonifractor phocaeensis]MBM6869512.1 hypothetical protein [Pseudoflavonifractor phocaeensis]